MENLSSKTSLIIGLSIPVVMIVAIAAAVLLPGRTLNPTTDFVYAIGSYPSYTTRNENTITQHDLSIKDGVLTDTKQSYQATPNYPPYPYEKESTPRFFLHNTIEDTNKEISQEDAMKLKLSSEAKSPDGFTVSFGRRSYGVFPFFIEGGQDNTEQAYLSNKTASKEITLHSEATRNYYSFQLVGWVVE